MSVMNTLNEQNLIYLTNALGEETGHKEVASVVGKWYENTWFDDEWLQYLVELNGEVGILALIEFTHPDADDWDSEKHNCSEKYRNATGEEIWTHLQSVAYKIKEKVDFEVFLGEKTGFMERHEICIWFPFGTDKKSLEETLKKTEEVDLLF